MTAAGLTDYKLTAEEEEALEKLETVEWKEYNLKALYGSSTRGKRLKSSDRIPGNLPFVTAGEADEGISDFIGFQEKYNYNRYVRLCQISQL